jgi:hypothetical protein
MCLHVRVAQMTNQTLAAAESRQSTIPEAERARRSTLEGQLRNRRKPLTRAASAIVPANGRFSQYVCTDRTTTAYENPVMSSAAMKNAPVRSLLPLSSF